MFDDCFTKKDLFSVLENIDDDSPIAVRVGDRLVYDVSFGFSVVDGVEVLVIGFEG